MNKIICNFFLNILNFKKQNDQINSLEEQVKFKTCEFDLYRKELEAAFSHKVDEKIRSEKALWEQEQNIIIRREIEKINDERLKDMANIQEELNKEKEKLSIEKNRSNRLEEVNLTY